MERYIIAVRINACHCSVVKLLIIEPFPRAVALFPCQIYTLKILTFLTEKPKRFAFVLRFIEGLKNIRNLEHNFKFWLKSMASKACVAFYKPTH